MKKQKRLGWHDKRELFEAVTRATILHISGHISNADFLYRVTQAITDHNCVHPLVVKNIPYLIDHLKNTLTLGDITTMNMHATSSGKTFYNHIMSSEINVGDSSGLIFICLLDSDFDPGMTYWIKRSMDAVAANDVTDLELDFGDRVELISPLLIPTLVSDKGVSFYTNRNINLNMFSNMIVAETADQLNEKDSVLVYLSKREGLVKVKKKYITLKQ